MINEWDITTTNQHRARDRKYEVAVLPTAAIEPHNLHLPLGQDLLHTTHVSRESCKAAWERCESVLWLPPLPYGVDCNLMGFPVAMHVSQAALDGMVRELVKSCRHYGIRKFVILNGHGGNDFGPLVRQIQCDLDVFVFVVNWWTVTHDRYDEFFSRPDDHAGQFETSVALALFPDLVELEHAGDGSTKEFRFEALREGWAKTSRNFGTFTEQCGTHDPEGASADRGQACLDLTIKRITDFLVELAQSEIDESFPFS